MTHNGLRVFGDIDGEDHRVGRTQAFQLIEKRVHIKLLQRLAEQPRPLTI